MEVIQACRQIQVHPVCLSVQSAIPVVLPWAAGVERLVIPAREAVATLVIPAGEAVATLAIPPLRSPVQDKVLRVRVDRRSKGVASERFNTVDGTADPLFMRVGFFFEIVIRWI